MYRVKNKTNENRRFRVHKTAKAYFIRPGEILTVPHPLIVHNPVTLEVTEIKEKEINEEETASDRSPKAAKRVTKRGGKK